MRCHIAIAVAIALAGSAAADPAAPITLPPGTHHDPTGQLIAGRGLRDTTDFIAKDLARRGVAARQVGPYRVRAIELTRFLSDTPTTPWLAIHVVRIDGKTAISFIPRPAAPSPP